MDITHQFKAAVLTIKLKRKGELSTQRILKKSFGNVTNGCRDEFSRKAKDVCNKITNLRNVLVESRSAYMRIGQHLKNATHMTDEQRDLIDRESEKFFIYYTQYLGQMRLDWKKAKRKLQHKKHFEEVLDILCSYLKAIQQMHQEQKKYRIQYELETHHFLKLAPDKKKIPVRPAAGKQRLRKISAASNTSSSTSQQNSPLPNKTENCNSNEGWDFDDIDITEPLLSSQENENSMRSTNDASLTDTKAQVALNEDLQTSHETEDKLSAEDIQMFEQENVQLYQELQGLSEEVAAIEKNVVDIANLQDIFTEKVSLQQHNIERIVNAVIGSTENVKDANEQIKQAIQRNAGLRVWSLFFLLVMSFTLLFLDWYYD